MERQYLTDYVTMTSQLSLNLILRSFTWFSSLYDWLLQPDDGLICVKLKCVAAMFVTMK